MNLRASHSGLWPAIVLLASATGPTVRNTEAVSVLSVDPQSALVFAAERNCAELEHKSGSILIVSKGVPGWRRIWGPKNSIEFQWALGGGHDIDVGAVAYREGPSRDPLFLHIHKGQVAFSAKIVGGNAGLEGLYKGDGAGYVALVRQLKLTGDGWNGPLRQYISSDGGRTWRVAETQGNVPTANAFVRLTTSSGSWTLAKLPDGGRQLLEASPGGADTKVATVASFPWRPCPNKEP